MSTIDTLLYRPLKSGTAFEGLIPAYKGTDFKFDKNSDNSTTYDTLRFMAQWSTKYASQMKRIAPLLRGKTIEETANNIYQFLYHHFQYKLDGEMQNLYSPSAAWHFRKTGFDCKTYSILASTILQNLNITHAFRMVQQAGIMPGEWSHVYVVIPNGNNYAIIDATTHTNKEVSFTKKHDYTMKHRGLASPYINGLGCACKGKPITRTGLGNPATMATTVAHFHTFLNELETKGVSREVTNRILELVKSNIQNGIDPNMHEIVTKAYAGTNQGLGLVLNDLAYEAGTAIGNTSIGGVNIGSTANQLLTGNFVGAGISIINAVIPLDKTFGAVFANGFDLSCWGSAFSEQAAKPLIEKRLPFIIEWSGIAKAATTENLDRFMWLTQANLNECLTGQQSKYVSCTRKGWALVQKAIEELKVNTLDQFKAQGFQLISAGQKTGSKWSTNMPDNPNYSAFANSSVKWDSYIVVTPAQIAAEKAAQEAAEKAGTQANGTNTTSPPAKKSSSLLLPLVGVGVLAAKFLI